MANSGKAVGGNVRMVLTASGKDRAGYAKALGITDQALNNKFSRDSFGTRDLLILAQYAGCELAFRFSNGTKIVLDAGELLKPEQSPEA